MRFIIRSAALALGTALMLAAPSREAGHRPWRLIRLYRGTAAGPANAVVLRPISASDCQRNGFDPAPPQETTALKYLRIEAAYAGADALVKVSCDSGPVKGCFAAITCGGQAVKLPTATVAISE